MNTHPEPGRFNHGRILTGSLRLPLRLEPDPVIVRSGDVANPIKGEKVTGVAAGESAVDRAAMARAANQVDAAVQVIRGLQSSMNGYNAALAGGWTGQAASAFATTYEMFSADFAKVLNALQMIHDKLVTTQHNYTVTEDANTTQVRRVASLLNQ
jgi:WXG100 family type VII secretion target